MAADSSEPDLMLPRLLPLKVLHISESDVLGGAARTAYKLHRGLIRHGHASRMLVGRRATREPEIRSVKRNVAWRAADRACGAVTDRLGAQYALYPSSFALPRDRWFRGADVLQLHNLHGSYFSWTALPVLTARLPAVWLLQDQWALTGHVTYPLECERWRDGCGSCPRLADYPPLRRDTTALLWRGKRAVYARSRLNLVVPSRWLLDAVRASPLLSRFPVVRIPHGVDTAVFRPRPRDAARRLLGLPLERRIVVFAATDLAEPRKGLALLTRALRLLDDPPLLVVVGSGEAPRDVEARSLGHLSDDATLAAAYCAADAAAVPTLADALTQTAVESIACGIPCVAFDRGGVTDVVREGETGRLAPYGDVRGLARGLETVLADPARYADRCRAVATEEFALDVQVRRYVEVYDRVVGAA